MSTKKIIFVTGTDTGVGKTLLAALLLYQMRKSSIHALAMKPFCSGGLDDVRLLQSLQPGELTGAEANPFYFEQPVAPRVALEKTRKRIGLNDVLKKISAVEKKCERLIIEGSGGLLVPLAQDFTVADLIAKLDCRVVVAARNRLGTINHTLLTVRVLEDFGIKKANISVVLMTGSSGDLSSKTNLRTLSQMLLPIKVFSIPFLGNKANSRSEIERSHTKIHWTLEKLAN
jgi:dethiobiotin synthetase